jgi:DNA-binding transcriptional LysR family regulator
MAEAEWLRTFLAVYRSGSVTEGARQRGLTQPAASQQVAALERAAGGPLFVRGPGGVGPTPQGRELYAKVAGPLDGLESVLDGLAGLGPGSGTGAAAVRFGSSPEYFAAEALPRLAGFGLPLSAVFGTDRELFALLDRGELDLAVTSSTPPRRSVSATSIGTRRYVLVAAPRHAPAVPLRSLAELGDWLAGRPWAAYSDELPRTRRFWLTSLGRPFATRPQLVIPDLRAVLTAVELGLGVSMLPAFLCRGALAAGRVVELFPVADLAPEEPWFACTRPGAAARASVGRLLTALRSGINQPELPAAGAIPPVAQGSESH